jgi:hypothetical protein
VVDERDVVVVGPAVDCGDDDAVWFVDDDADVDGLGRVVVVARGLDVVATGRLVAVGAGFDAAGLGSVAGRTRM